MSSGLLIASTSWLEINNQADLSQLAQGANNTADLRAMPSGRIANLSIRLTNLSASPGTSPQEQDPPQPAIRTTGSTASEASTSRPYAEHGYSWSVGKVEDRSAVFHGLAGDTRLEPAPSGQQVSFKVGTMKDDARAMGGVMSDAALDNFFNTTAREKRVGALVETVKSAS